MNKPISLIVLITGIMVIFYAIAIPASSCSDISKIFLDLLTQRTIVLLCGGAVYIALGGYGLARRA